MVNLVKQKSQITPFTWIIVLDHSALWIKYTKLHDYD